MQSEDNIIANTLLSRVLTGITGEIVITDDGSLIGDITDQTRSLLVQYGVLMKDEKTYYCG